MSRRRLAVLLACLGCGASGAWLGGRFGFQRGAGLALLVSLVLAALALAVRESRNRLAAPALARSGSKSAVEAPAAAFVAVKAAEAPLPPAETAPTVAPSEGLMLAEPEPAGLGRDVLSAGMIAELASLRGKLDEDQERLKRLQALIMHHQTLFNQASVGKTMTALFDRDGKYEGQLLGKSPYNQSVHVMNASHLRGQLAEVKITGAFLNSVSAEIVTSSRGAVFADAKSVSTGSPEILRLNAAHLPQDDNEHQRKAS